MSAYFNTAKSRWFFEFDKVIGGRRVRATKMLPKGWNRTKAEAFSRTETDRLYQIATGTTKERHTIEQAVELYVTHKCPSLKHGDETVKELARTYWCYQGRYIDEISEVAREYTAAERARVSPATIKKNLSFIRAACRYAQKHHGIGGNEIISIAMPAVSNERHVYATRQDVLKISRHCSCKHAKALVWMAFYTGMRLGELMKIGGDAPIKDGNIYLYDTKNSMPHIVPIHPRAMAACQFFPIPFQIKRMQVHIRKAMDNAGFKHMRFHDLRHSAASAMINNGVDLYTVSAVLNHKDIRSTRRYSHFATKTLAEAIRKIR